MPMIDRTNDEVAALLAKNDRIRAEAVAERPIAGSRALQRATPGRDSLMHRRQDDARRDSANHAAESPGF
jgi:hypothetical protein